MVIAQGIKNDMLIAAQNRSSMPKKSIYMVPVNVTDNNAAIAEMTAVCRTGDKLDIVVFMKTSNSGHILNGCADEWLTRWSDLAGILFGSGAVPAGDRHLARR